MSRQETDQELHRARVPDKGANTQWQAVKHELSFGYKRRAVGKAADAAYIHGPERACSSSACEVYGRAGRPRGGRPAASHAHAPPTVKACVREPLCPVALVPLLKRPPLRTQRHGLVDWLPPLAPSASWPCVAEYISPGAAINRMKAVKRAPEPPIGESLLGLLQRGAARSGAIILARK